MTLTPLIVYDNLFYGLIDWLIDNLCDFLMSINSIVMLVLSDDENWFQINCYTMTHLTSLDQFNFGYTTDGCSKDTDFQQQDDHISQASEERDSDPVGRG